MKKVLSLVVSTLLITGGAFTFTIVTVDPAHAACYSNLTMHTVHNKTCAKKIRHVNTVQGKSSYAPWAAKGKKSIQPFCAPGAKNPRVEFKS